MMPTMLKRKKSKDRSEPDLAKEIAVKSLEIGEQLQQNTIESDNDIENNQDNQRSRSRSRERATRANNMDNYIHNIMREDPAMAAMASDPLGKIFLNSSQNRESTM
jgi:hypothetical protein